MVPHLDRQLRAPEKYSPASCCQSRKHFARLRNADAALAHGAAAALIEHETRRSGGMTESRATFIFDGECGICRTWVDYWRQIVDTRVDFRPYQEAAADY